MFVIGSSCAVCGSYLSSLCLLVMHLTLNCSMSLSLFYLSHFLSAIDLCGIAECVRFVTVDVTAWYYVY